MLEHALKLQPFKEILAFQDWKRGYETYTKLIRQKKFKPEIKPIIRNLQENKQAKGTKPDASIRWKLEGKKSLKLFSKYLKERICKIKQDLGLYWW